MRSVLVLKEAPSDLVVVGSDVGSSNIRVRWWDFKIIFIAVVLVGMMMLGGGGIRMLFEQL